MTIRALPMPKQYGRSYIIIMSIMLIRPAKIPAEKAAKVPLASRTDAQRSLEDFSTFPDILPFPNFCRSDACGKSSAASADFFKIHRKRLSVKPIPEFFLKKTVPPSPIRFFHPLLTAHPRKKSRLFSFGNLTRQNQNANVMHKKSHSEIFKPKQS